MMLRPGILPAAVGTGLLGGLLIAVVFSLPEAPVGLSDAVLERLQQSGVSYPVTAVLLNFRAYDTWLELGVLLLGVAGVFVLLPPGGVAVETQGEISAVLTWLARILVPLMILVGGYLLWLGKVAAGGAFQAGVVFGVAGVLLWLSGNVSVTRGRIRTLRMLMMAGFCAFTVTALLTMAAGRGMLDLPEGAAGLIIVMIEALASLSIGITITALLIGVQAMVRKDGVTS